MNCVGPQLHLLKHLLWGSLCVQIISAIAFFLVVEYGTSRQEMEAKAAEADNQDVEEYRMEQMKRNEARFG